MFASLGEAAVHTLTVILSVMVLAISLLAYRKVRGQRYAFLAVGFLLLAISQAEQFFESYYLNAYVYLPYFEIHLSHLIDLAMLVSFGTALLVK